MILGRSRPHFSILRLFRLAFLFLIPGTLSVASLSQAGVAVKPFGQSLEGAVRLYTLTNKHGIQVSIMDYGATVVSVVTPDRNGHLDDIALGFDHPSDYANAPLNFGTMGRYINRIDHGRVILDGQVYPLTKNKGATTMHGGKLGFNRHLWRATVVSEDPPDVRFFRVSPDGEEGFPGNLRVNVTFTLTDDDHWNVHYEAETDKTTVVNLSNHTLFNLSGPGHGTILHDVVKINAATFTPVDASSVPTGEIRSVCNSPWDLRSSTIIKTHLHDLGNEPPGYDLNYVLDKDWWCSVSEAGEVYDPSSGRELQVFTDQPGVQFYTGNLFDGSLIGKGGIRYTRYCAFSLEAQHFPDSPNHPNFPSTLLRPGNTYCANIEYRFSTK